MFYAFDLYCGDSRALDRRKQSPTQRIADSRSEAALERLGRKTAVPFGKCLSDQPPNDAAFEILSKDYF